MCNLGVEKPAFLYDVTCLRLSQNYSRRTNLKGQRMNKFVKQFLYTIGARFLLCWAFVLSYCRLKTAQTYDRLTQCACTNTFTCRSEWPCGLRRKSAAARFLGMRVRISLEGMDVRL